MAEKVSSTFNSFNGKNTDVLASFYSPNVLFQDPVVRVTGLENLQGYLKHAYRQVKSIRFEFGNFISEGKSVSAQWTMHVQVNGLNGGKPYTVDGCSFFEFDQDDKVIFHRDSFDVGSLVYERLPIHGAVIRVIKKFLSHGYGS